MKNKQNYTTTVFIVFFSFFTIALSAQKTFVRTSGQQILDINGENLIIRSIGTGNWFLQEGYMMNISGVAGTQWEFRKKLIETIGETRTDEFYTAWWDNHFTKADVDSMASWGFNSIRVALHYKIFTLPIEDEPVEGENTWLEDGFERLDNLLQWCADNEIYLILDMHGAPGGQGSNADISDYDPSKPSLWESEQNKLKLIALWRKLAERYADEQWIGGYDLINEPNWELPNSNRDLWDLFKRITTAIREVDANHMLILGGNWWGNDYNGLPAMWDNNIVLSFHKYWNYNTVASIQWMLDLRKQHNVPIWLGESGENSNTWFTDLITLCEENNIGWSWWPVKKMGINNVIRSASNTAYDQFLSAWKNGKSIDAYIIYKGVMQLAEDHKIEKCIIQYDVIDALITRPHTQEARPYKKHTVDDIIYAVDYDFGPQGTAYHDTNDADYHQDEGKYTTWNAGWAYRNDGVDIQTCNNSQTNGFSVAWIEPGEWLHYTVEVPQAKAYGLQIRYASNVNNAVVHVEINGKRATSTFALPSTGGWDSWKTTTIPNVIVPEGKARIKIIFENGGVNFSYFKFVVPKDVSTVNFEILGATTDELYGNVILQFNKAVDEFAGNSFDFAINNEVRNITGIKKKTENENELQVSFENYLLNTDEIKVGYNAENCKNGNQNLKKFSDFPVANKLAQHAFIPERVEAENYVRNSGFETEICEDTGGGLNTSYADTGDYLDYVIIADYTGEHEVDFRVSVNSTTARIALYDITEEKNNYLKQVELKYTGGWQSWQTQRSTVPLKAGRNVLRIRANSDGFNLNWFQIRAMEGAGNSKLNFKDNIQIYPNPVSEQLFLQLPENISEVDVALFSLAGKMLFAKKCKAKHELISLDMRNIAEGNYFIRVENNEHIAVEKIIIKRK